MSESGLTDKSLRIVISPKMDMSCNLEAKTLSIIGEITNHSEEDIKVDFNILFISKPVKYKKKLYVSEKLKPGEKKKYQSNMLKAVSFFNKAFESQTSFELSKPHSIRVAIIDKSSPDIIIESRTGSFADGTLSG